MVKAAYCIQYNEKACVLISYNTHPQQYRSLQAHPQIRVVSLDNCRVCDPLEHSSLFSHLYNLQFTHRRNLFLEKYFSGDQGYWTIKLRVLVNCNYLQWCAVRNYLKGYSFNWGLSFNIRKQGRLYLCVI